MQKYLTFGLILSLVGGTCFAEHPRIAQLIAEKQQKMKKLEDCQGTTKALKIAGISTLGITAVGVAGNIAEAVILSDTKDKLKSAKSDLEKEQKKKEEHDAADAKKAEEEAKAKAEAERKEKEAAAFRDICNTYNANPKTDTQCTFSKQQEFENIKGLLINLGFTCSDAVCNKGEYQATFNVNGTVVQVTNGDGAPAEDPKAQPKLQEGNGQAADEPNKAQPGVGKTFTTLCAEKKYTVKTVDNENACIVNKKTESAGKNAALKQAKDLANGFNCSGFQVDTSNSSNIVAICGAQDGKTNRFYVQYKSITGAGSPKNGSENPLIDGMSECATKDESGKCTQCSTDWHLNNGTCAPDVDTNCVGKNIVSCKKEWYASDSTYRCTEIVCDNQWQGNKGKCICEEPKQEIKCVNGTADEKGVCTECDSGYKLVGEACLAKRLPCDKVSGFKVENSTVCWVVLGEDGKYSYSTDSNDFECKTPGYEKDESNHKCNKITHGSHLSQNCPSNLLSRTEGTNAYYCDLKISGSATLNDVKKKVDEQYKKYKCDISPKKYTLHEDNTSIGLDCTQSGNSVERVFVTYESAIECPKDQELDATNVTCKAGCPTDQGKDSSGSCVPKERDCANMPDNANQCKEKLQDNGNYQCDVSALKCNSGYDPSKTECKCEAKKKVVTAKGREKNSKCWEYTDEWNENSAGCSGMNNETWWAKVDSKEHKGISKCSETEGTSGQAGTPSDTDGKGCWCKATASWVFLYSSDSASNCAGHCASNCAYDVLNDSVFRSALGLGG